MAAALEELADLPATGPGALSPGVAHVVAVALTGDAAQIGAARAVLDAGELARAARFRAARDGERFVLAHAGLRAVLGRVLGVPPASVTFERRAGGKPVLGGGADAALAFNLTHAGTLALVAVTAADEIGVDVEQEGNDDTGRAALDVLALAESQLGAREAAALRALASPEARAALFYALWTRKEAVLKAMGVGLARPPAEIEVDANDDESAWRDPQTGRTWHVRALSLAPPHVGAVATGVPLRSCRLWRL